MAMIQKHTVFIIYTIFTLLTASACSLLENNWFQVVVFIFLLSSFFYRRHSIDNEIVFFLGLWCIINMAAYLYYEAHDFKTMTFLSVTSRMLFPYFMMKIVGESFFNRLFNYWFILCVLSFPPFLIESFFPDLLQSLAPKLSFMTGAEQKESGGFYLFFYMHSGWAERFGPFVRNSGFMWEPGAFALVLIFMIVYHLLDKEMKLDWKTGFLTFCLVTTFSTAGYIAFFVVLILYIYRNKVLSQRYRFLTFLFSIVFIISGYQLYQNTEFLSGKVNQYLEGGTETWEVNIDEKTILRVSRLGIAMIALDNSLQYPFGDGIVESDYVRSNYHNPSGPNSLATILFQWGWFGIITLFFCLYNFRVNHQKCGFMFMIPLIILLFSNPFAFRYLIYAIVFSVILYNRININRGDTYNY